MQLALTQLGVSRHPISLFQPQQIAELQLVGAQLQLPIAAAHPGPGRRQPGQFGEGAVAAQLLQAIQQADAQHEHQQDGAIHRFADQAVDQGTGQQQQIGRFQHAEAGQTLQVHLRRSAAGSSRPGHPAAAAADGKPAGCGDGRR